MSWWEACFGTNPVGPHSGGPRVKCRQVATGDEGERGGDCQQRSWVSGTLSTCCVASGRMYWANRAGAACNIGLLTRGSIALKDEPGEQLKMEQC